MPNPDTTPPLGYAMRDRREMLRAMILERGGRFHGPRAEHLSMEEGAFWRFLDEVMEMVNGN